MDEFDLDIICDFDIIEAPEELDLRVMQEVKKLKPKWLLKRWVFICFIFLLNLSIMSIISLLVLVVLHPSIYFPASQIDVSVFTFAIVEFIHASKFVILGLAVGLLSIKLFWGKYLNKNLAFAR